MTLAAAPSPAQIREAHRAVRADPSIQFDFPWRRVAPPDNPEWLERLAKALQGFFEALGPVWTWVFWGLVAALTVVLVVTLFPPLRAWVMAMIGRRQAQPEPAHWTPQASAARALLDEADRLATDGHYDQAVQLLLYRSIEDIERWRGGIVRPSSTARDIAAFDALPMSARAVFGRIAALVERGIFARRPLAAEDWRTARDAYAGFAL